MNYQNILKLGNEDNYFKLLGLFLLFFLLAFDQNLAMVYLFIMLADWIWYRSDNFISFPMIKGKTSLMVLLESLAGLGIFLAISTFLVQTFEPQAIASGSIFSQAQSIFHLLAASTPILQDSVVLTFIGWGIIVPIVETNFFNGRLLEGFSSYYKDITGKTVSLDKMSTGLWVIIFIVAALFALFHITAKGLNSIPLLITFIFSVISSLLVIRHKKTVGAVFMHIVTNSLAVGASLGWISG